MDAWIAVATAGVNLLMIYLTWRTNGAFFALLGGNLTMFIVGWLMAKDPTLTINGGVTVGCGTAGNPVCGYAFTLNDFTLVVLLLSALTIAAFLVAMDAYWSDDSGIKAHR